MGWWNVGVGCLTVPREVKYDETTNRLTTLPVIELTGLHGTVIGSQQNALVSQGDVLPLLKMNSSSFDLNITVRLSRCFDG